MSPALPIRDEEALPCPSDWSFELIEERQTKLVERSEGQLHLGFRAGCPHHATSVSVCQ